MASELTEIPIHSEFYGSITGFEQDTGISQPIARNARAVWEGYNVQEFGKHLKAGDTAVDVGAYIGLHTIAIQKFVGPAGKVIAFEGQRRFHNVLCKNTCGFPNVEAILAAVGSPEQSGQYTDEGSINMTNPGGSGLGTTGQSDTGVKFVCLDEYRDAMRGVKLIKIDVEGNELHVIKGARAVLAENSPFIVMEIYGGYVPAMDPWRMTELNAKDEYIMTVIRYMEGLGYAVMHRVAHDYFFQKVACPPA